MGLVHLTALCHRAPKKKEKEDVKKLKSTTRVFFFFGTRAPLLFLFHVKRSEGQRSVTLTC